MSDVKTTHGGVERRRAAIIAHTLAQEGGWVNNPADPGGATKHGISLRWLRKQGEHLGDIDGDGDIDADDIRALTADDAADFYAAKFWDKEYDALVMKTPATVARVFDLAVNTGPRQAHKFVQRAINSLAEIYSENIKNAEVESVKVDGVLGQRTARAWRKVAAIEKRRYYKIIAEKNRAAAERAVAADSEPLELEVISHARVFYAIIIEKNPALAQFLPGWRKRLERSAVVA